jgi:signal transduction histidine kinase/DNA-binding response OmpR family regulator
VLNRAGTLLDFKGEHHADLLLPPTQFLGRPLEEVLPGGLGARLRLHLDAVFATGIEERVEYSLPLDGVEKDFEARLVRASPDQVLAVIRNITERRQLERMKNEFVSVVSHELRTPLTSIRGALGLLAGGAMGPLSERASHLVEIAASNCERLVRLINDILDIEKIESGRMRFALRPLDLVALVDSAIESNRVYGENFKVRFELTSTSGPVRVQADPDRLTQVLTNLLSNAAKFSPAGSSVGVEVTTGEGQARVAVTDRGTGIPESFRSRIFERFAQADGSDQRKVGGSGLGLAISKLIVERHGGSISFSTASGAGTTFYFTIPLDGDATDPGRPVDGLAKILVGTADAALGARVAVALVGFRVVAVTDAAAASSALAGHAFAAAMLDAELVGEPRLRSLLAATGLPVVVLVGEGIAQSAVPSSPGLDVREVVAKPVDAATLLEVVARVLGVERARRARILHVEDDADVLTVVHGVLQPVADVTPVRSLAQARAALGDDEFDLVLLDLELPDGSGLDLYPIADASGKRVPVVLFSAHDPGESTVENVAAVLVKSRTSNEDLLDTVRFVLRPRPGSPSA